MSEDPPTEPTASMTYRTSPAKACTFLVLFLVVAGVILMKWPDIHRPDLEFVGYGHAFDGDEKLPAGVIQKAFGDARTSMLDRVQLSRTLETLSIALQWIGFSLGAVVTAIAGYHWSSSENLKPAELKAAFGRKAKNLRIVGVLSALATIFAVAATKTSEASTSTYERARDTQARLNSAMTDLQKARNADEAQAVLDNLSLRK